MQLSWQQAIGIEQSHLVEISDGLGKPFQIHKAIVKPLEKLFSAAQQAGVSITVVSAYRSFERQLSIWNDKWLSYRPVYSRHGRPLNLEQMSDIEKYKAVALWSALPGMSRHHWGTDLDIFAAAPVEAGYQVNLTPDEFLSGAPSGELENWLNQHLETYGFFRPYRIYQNGVSQEPWHISHQQISQQIFDNFDYNEYRGFLENSDISAKSFILSQINHYKKQYFSNICMPNHNEATT